jgi:hypothetical protein
MPPFTIRSTCIIDHLTPPTIRCISILFSVDLLHIELFRRSEGRYRAKHCPSSAALWVLHKHMWTQHSSVYAALVEGWQYPFRTEYVRRRSKRPFIFKALWLHAHALNVRVDLEGPVAALDGMKSEANVVSRTREHSMRVPHYHITTLASLFIPFRAATDSSRSTRTFSACE